MTERYLEDFTWARPSSQVNKGASGSLFFASRRIKARASGANGIDRLPVFPVVTVKVRVRSSKALQRALVSSPARQPVDSAPSTRSRTAPWQASLRHRRKAVARLLKIHLRTYPEHVIAQAIRVATNALTADRRSAFRAILAAERHAQARMGGGREPQPAP
jgi:hypothetical protein